MRRVVRRDDVDHAFPQSFHDGLPVRFASERRIDPGVRVVRGFRARFGRLAVQAVDPVVRERKVVRRHLGGHSKPGVFGPENVLD